MVRQSFMHSHPPDQGLKLTLLGGFEAQLNGRAVAGIAYNKMRALLAYLAVEREQDHRRDVLADLLWSGSDVKTARGNLRRTLADLRRVLELPGGVVIFSATKHTLRFIQNGYVDVIDFTGRPPVSPVNGAAEQYHEERILALYRGEFLAGLFLPDCPAFEDWLQLQRETLQCRALVLLEQLSNRQEQIGNYSRALQFALRSIELEPWDEDAHCRTMRLYALNGQTGAAINQYQACCRLLKNELGVLPSEETRQLAERIRNGDLRGELPGTVSLSQTIAQLPAERRQVTVLYSELTPAAIDDPDEAMALLHAPQARCVEIIRRLSGHVVQTHGGGLLAYFGYPQAHESAARRAVQAALAVTGETALGIEIRAAVHTGLVITGGASSLPDRSGKTSRIAIQLCHEGVQKKVVISQETLDIVAGYFDCVSLGSRSFPGFQQALEIFEVVRESGARTRLDAATRLTPLAGRRAEIARLLQCWREAAQGLSRVVLVRGEAGIGKSRLLHALKERLTEQPYALRELRCFPEFSQSPFHPVIDLLESSCGFTPGDTPGMKSVKLAEHLQIHCPTLAPDAVPLLTELLSLPLGEPYSAPGLSPQKHKERTNAVLLAMLQALTVRQPVLLIVEDLHWIDPSSLDLLSLLVQKKGGEAILTLLTARTGFIPPWDDELHSTLALTPLAADGVAEMIASICEDMPAATLRRIVERADGVPLFVEEMAKIAATSRLVDVPATLLDLLAARLDDMGEAKYTAQLAATLGREFDLNLLGKVFPHARDALARSLSALQDAGLLLKMKQANGQFKHALIQEAAYQSQAKPDRQAAHRRIAQALLKDFPDVVANQPELLARHLAAGGAARGSVEYWLKAGQRAAQSSANTEAIEHFKAGLQLLQTLPPDQERDRLESDLCLNLGTVLSSARGYGSVEAAQAYVRALALAEQLGDGAILFKTLCGMWLTSSSRAGHLHALELAIKLLHMARQLDEPLSLQFAHYAMGNSLLWTGQLDKSRLHFESSMALYEASHHAAMVRNFGENVCVSSGSLLSWLLWLRGYPEQAVVIGKRALSLARQVNHSYSLGFALCSAAMLHRWLSQVETTSQLALEAVALSERYGLPFSLGISASCRGWVLAMQGQPVGIAQIQQCLHAASTIMSGTRLLFFALLIEARMPLGQIEQALADLTETLAVANKIDDRFFESEFHRLKGECQLALIASDAAEAQACFNQALMVSRKQGAKSLELRAAMSMARLWRQQDRHEDGRRLLEEIVNWFAEGFDTPDLEQARALLESLRRPELSASRNLK